MAGSAFGNQGSAGQGTGHRAAGRKHRREQKKNSEVGQPQDKTSQDGSKHRGSHQGIEKSHIFTTATLWLALLPKVLSEGQFLILGMMPVAFTVTASTLILVLVTILTPPPEQAIVEKFFPQ